MIGAPALLTKKGPVFSAAPLFFFFSVFCKLVFLFFLCSVFSVSSLGLCSVSCCSNALHSFINLALSSRLGMYPFKSNFVLQTGGSDHSKRPTISASENFEARVPPGNKGRQLLIQVIAAAVFCVLRSDGLKKFLVIQSC